MSETGLYQKQLREMYDLRGNGEGAVLSYIKRNFITFEKGNTLNNESIVAFFADYGFDKVLREMASREMDFYAAKHDFQLCGHARHKARHMGGRLYQCQLLYADV